MRAEMDALVAAGDRGERFLALRGRALELQAEITEMKLAAGKA